ncbi:hypothetical protein GS988_06785 [Rhodococcus hoagii]|nr:hypothetical protein [Prescottella equi]
MTGRTYFQGGRGGLHRHRRTSTAHPNLVEAWQPTEVRALPVALPASTTVTLEAGARTFPATVTTDSVSWRIEPADADLIPDRSVVRIRCTFLDDPTTGEPWLKGVVARDD